MISTTSHLSSVLMIYCCKILSNLNIVKYSDEVLRADCINERVGAYYYSFVLYEYSDPLLTHSLEMLINKSNPSITLASQHQRENMQKKIRHNFCFKLPQQVKINLKINLSVLSPFNGLDPKICEEGGAIHCSLIHAGTAFI